jgi:hypothetical protein
MTKRRTHDAAFRARVALEAVKGTHFRHLHPDLCLHHRGWIGHFLLLPP